MIDFHAHILSGIDDGPQSRRTSMKMLSASKKSGVTKIIATPHFYCDQDNIDNFLKKRSVSYARLLKVIQDSELSLPDIILGCEVYLVNGISKLNRLDELCIAGTNYMLVEMPYSDWSDEHFEELYHLIHMGFRPILAHLDRFFSKEKLFPELLSLNPLCQINAESVIDKKSRRKILKLFSKDAAHVLGSDMHNMDLRPPNLAEAYDIISNKFGDEYNQFLRKNAQMILQNEDIPEAKLPELSAIQKLML